MSASKQRDSSIERNSEYDTFIARLQEFHDQRGTTLDPAPRVGNRRVDLLKLYKRVTGDGGYDVVSDTKSQKLAWRKIGQEFHLGNATLPTLAFTLKTAYYKNLSAYEIKTLHGKEPPPKEILEDVSAKGADLLNRTVENYSKPTGRDERNLTGGDPDSSDADHQRTPNAEKIDVEDPNSTSGRVTRGLRQAPPPRQMFQSEMPASRQTRHQSGQAASPTPAYNPYGATNGTYASNNVPLSLANYEPKQQFPLTLRPLLTPGNNHEQFKAEQKRIRGLLLARNSKTPLPTKGIMLPGTGFTGPSIYVRTLLALQSGIIDEQEYALHHLVKISFERGDKYRFDSFAGLAEGLIQKVLEVGDLCLDVEWTITYENVRSIGGEGILDQNSKSTDVMGSIKMSKKRKRQDRLEPEIFSRRMALINEAGLVLRNMAMLDENAEYLARYPTSRSLLIILLNLPQRASTAEVQQYGLEIAEQLTRYLSPSEDDQLFKTLLGFVEQNDRGVILAALRAICRYGSYVQQNARLESMPMHTIQRLCAWVVVEDEELRGASLDLLYQYTAVPANVDRLMANVNVDSFVKQLVSLLMHGAKVEEKKDIPRAAAPKPVDPVQDTPIPKICQAHVEQLLGYDEPERSSEWLKACFAEDPNGEITQIALWQAYQIPFAPYGAQRPLLPAKDFITNVSTTFATASAQVMNAPQTGQPRFVIKGIRARKVPVDTKGNAYMRCMWQQEDGTECGEFARWPKQMFEHCVQSHVKIPKDSDGKYDFEPQEDRTYTCEWAGCKRFSRRDSIAGFALGMHIKTHLPDSTEKSYQRSKHNDSQEKKTVGPGVSRTWQVQNTQIDERNDAAGLPLTSVLIMRNLARNIPKTATAAKKEGQGSALVQRYFLPVRGDIFFVMSCNQSLRDYLPSLLKQIDAAGG